MCSLIYRWRHLHIKPYCTHRESAGGVRGTSRRCKEKKRRERDGEMVEERKNRRKEGRKDEWKDGRKKVKKRQVD